MSKRRQGREIAMQFLYQKDYSMADAKDSLDATLERFCLTLDDPPANDAKEFAEELIRGCVAKLDDVDVRIQKSADNWDIHRIAAVDRAILRLAIYEMLFRDDIPPVVSINEAVELAKKFSTAESGKFVNGVLDRIRKELNRPARQAK